MKTTTSFNSDSIDQKWWVVDFAETSLPVGRAASRIAHVLRGKHKPQYTPHADTGDFVIVLNADKAAFTGRKENQKEYFWHTGYFGGIKSITAEKLRAKDPAQIVEKAVKGMLPKNPLGRAMFRKLKVYAGTEHPHTAQQPQPLDLKTI